MAAEERAYGRGGRAAEPASRLLLEAPLELLQPHKRRHEALVAARRRLIVSVAVAAISFLLPLSVVAVHTLIVQRQFRLDSLVATETKQVQLNQELRAQVATLEAPSRIVAFARSRLGMSTPASVTYLSPVNLSAVNLSAVNPHPVNKSNPGTGTARP
ncbi:MAG: FtsB/FtsL family cell division protein [Acidimicrobiales bacterium]